MTTNEKTIIAFHIGRGDIWTNQGYLTFLGEKKIGTLPITFVATLKTKKILKTELATTTRTKV